MVKTASRAAPSEPDAGLSFGSLPNKIGFHLRLCQEASFRAFATRVGDADLKPQRFAILTLIAENPGITQTVLSRCSGRDKSTLTPALADLEKRGLVERRQDADDRRSYKLHLTTAGDALLAQLRRHADAHDRELDRIIGGNKAEFIRMLQLVTMSLSQQAD